MLFLFLFFPAVLLTRKCQVSPVCKHRGFWARCLVWYLALVGTHPTSNKCFSQLLYSSSHIPIDTSIRSFCWRDFADAITASSCSPKPAYSLCQNTRMVHAVEREAAFDCLDLGRTNSHFGVLVYHILLAQLTQMWRRSLGWADLIQVSAAPCAFLSLDPDTELCSAINSGLVGE